MKRQWLLKTLRVLLCMVIVAIGYTAWSIYAYGNTSETVQADAAIVLGAAAWGDQPSPVFRERINHAIELYRNGIVRKIIFTGGQGDANEPPEANVAQKYAVECGVLEGDILTETLSRTTQQNLYYAGQVAANHHLTKFLIVSDPLHMKRALVLARDLGMEAYPSPTPTTRYISLGSKIGFLGRETYFYITYLLGRPFDPLLRNKVITKPVIVSAAKQSPGVPEIARALCVRPSALHSTPNKSEKNGLLAMTTENCSGLIVTKPITTLG